MINRIRHILHKEQVNIKKIGNILLILESVIAISLIIIAVMRTVPFWDRYRDIMLVSVSKEENEQLELEVEELQETLNSRETELKEITSEVKRKQGKSIDWEQEVRECYIEKEELKIKVNALIMTRLNQLNYIHYDDTVEKTDVLGAIVDEATGNVIISSGIKAAIEEAGNNMSIESILEAGVEGMKDGVGEFIVDTGKGYIEDYVGFSIFSVIDFANQIMQIDDIPKTFANNIMEDQLACVEQLNLLVNQDEIYSYDMKFALELLKEVEDREKDIVKVSNREYRTNTNYNQIEELVNKYCLLEFRILQYASIQGGKNDGEE